MMNKSTTYRLDRMVLIFFLFVILLASSAFFYRYYSTPDCPHIAFGVSADTIEAGQMVMFTNQTAGLKRAQWDFGDNSPLVHKLHAGHTYSKPGEYLLRLTVNGSCTDFRRLVVVPRKQRINHALVPKLSGPGRVEVNKAVQFKCLTENATRYEWRFGESGRVDSREKNPSYKFSSPGLKTVSLVIDGNEKYIARQTVHVLPAAAPQSPRQQVLESRRAAAAAQPTVHIPDDPGQYARYDPLKVQVREQPQEKIKVLSNDELMETIKHYAQGSAKAAQVKTSYCEKSENLLVEANGRLVNLSDFLATIQGQNLRIRDFRTIRSEAGCVQQIIIRYRK